MFGSIVVEQKAQLPQLVGDVLAGVGDGAVGAHQDFVGVVHVGEFGAGLQRHDPTAGVLAHVFQPDCPRIPQDLESSLPETEVEDVRLMRQQVVRDAEPGHGGLVAAHVSVGHCRPEARHCAAVEFLARHHRSMEELQRSVEFELAETLFNSVKDLGPVLGKGRVIGVTVGDSRVDLPAEIVEVRRRRRRNAGFRQPFHHLLDELIASARLDSQALGELGLGQIEHPYHNVGHLDPGVVDVVLDLHLGAEAAQAAAQNVAQHRVTEVADVGGLVGVDCGVLDDCFGAGQSLAGVLAGEEAGQHQVSVEVKIEETRTGYLDPDDLIGPLGHVCYLLCDLPWGSLEYACQRQRSGPGEVTEFALGRHLEEDLVRAMAERRFQC